MPKPWPEKPVATTRPGTSSTALMTGTASGVTSIIPAHCWTTCIPANTGNAALSAVTAPPLMPGAGSASSVRTCSNGLGASSAQVRGVRASAMKRPSRRRRRLRRVALAAGRNSRKKCQVSGTSGTTLAEPLAMVSPPSLRLR